MTLEERQKYGPVGMIEMLSGIDPDAEIWQGDSNDWIIGDMPSSEDGEYALIGRVSNAIAEYRDMA